MASNPMTPEREDMANVGEALMEAIRDCASCEPLKGWHPADCPSEIVGDLLCMVEDRDAQIAAKDAEIAALREGLQAIDQLCSDEITTRFGGNCQKSEAEMGKNSRVYSLLVLPRNLARAALQVQP